MAEPTTGFTFVQDVIVRANWAHKQVQHFTQELSSAELCRSFGPTAPPIGWHIWHLIRWADRVQATLPNGTDQPDPDKGVWQQQQLALHLGLDVTTLGLFESGVAMTFADAATLPDQLGKAALMDYVDAVVQRTTDLLNGLDAATLTSTRPTARNFTIEAGKPVLLPNRKSEVFPDLSFLLAHSIRHLGMIEALVGLLQRAGSASI